MKLAINQLSELWVFLSMNEAHVLLFEGDVVTLRCKPRPPGYEKKVTFYRDGSPLEMDRNHQSHIISDTAVEMIYSVSVSDSGAYKCKFDGGGESEKRQLQVEGRRRITLTADSYTIRGQQSVTLTCYVEDSAGWKYQWFRQTSTDSGKVLQTANVGESDRLRISQGGIYTCRGWRSDPDAVTPESNAVTIQETVKAVVTLQPNGPLIYSGETITVRCEIERGGNTGWEYEWSENNVVSPQKDKEYRISASSSSYIIFMCKGRRDFYFSTEWSETVTLRRSLNKAEPTLTADSYIIPVGGSVTLTCSVDSSADWKYYWFRRDSGSSALQSITNVKPVNKVSEGGIYQCRAGRGDPEIFTEDSRAVTVWKHVSNKAVVTLQPNGPLIYSGETITVRCEIGGGNTRWEYEWSRNNMDISHKDNEYKIIRASVSHSGNYRCKGRKDSYSSTEWSDVFTLTVSSNKPKPTLTADKTITPVGGSVTLTCSVDGSADWKYDWFRQTSESSAPQLIRNVNLNRVISVYQGGIYYCRGGRGGGRGDSVFYTEDSNTVTIQETVPNKAAVVTLQPNWTEIYSGETIMLRCEIHDGDTEWEYEWKSPRYTSTNNNEYMISKASSYDSGNYSCRGKKKNAQHVSEWSADIKLTVSYNKPAPVLTVSPLWLSPGDSVTLSCEVEHPSAGWRFYWYKTVPKLSDNSYIYELLPGSINGIVQNIYTVNGSTHTAGYKCRAGRGDPVYYTRYSKPGFVWSGDVHSAVTLKVSPDRVQHFTSDSVSLSCEGNFTKCRVRRFSEDYSDCYKWRSITGSTCNIKRYQQSDAVYWCESGSGEFSNTVNITIQKADIILVSPVHPVTEGQSVTLGCKLRTGELPSNVFFYQNDKLIQSDTRRELNISAVSKSDEGFYKCKYSGEESAQSWMSVQAVSRPENSSSLIPLIVGLVCGVVFIILLILLYLYRRSKGSLFIRPIQPESTNQNETQHNENSSSLHDADESQNVTYSLIELKNFAKTGKRQITVESSVYAEVKTGSAADDGLTYAQVNHDIKGKAKKHKGKSAPAATDEAVYSEVKPGTAHGNNSVMLCSDCNN
ncbi:basement membrane-specific heparan sulfate proteoglycan core protein-like [Scomber scombrus]|uniref:basement membrane-specific heparan sulfate proteoglycan core protein-like n=1 Tax=Scomber scombrus TaxID=13677 RepID=UPI002DD86EBE|nr:basement membrane-specific heparan sulfate proteoglycan core protein-like [Scomber scombrus]